MNKLVNYHIEDGNTLDETVTRNITALQEKGFDPENQTTLQSCIADTTAKEKAQIKAEKDREDKTAEQNTTVSETVDLIRKVRGAALTAYDTDKRTQALFNAGINKKVPTRTNGVRSECEYLSTVIPGREQVLLKNGLVREDINNIISASARIVAVDKVQEDAKKLLKSATEDRDLSVKALKAIKKKIRNFVKTAYANNSVMLVQFEPMARGRGGSSGDNTNTPPAPPAQ